jgi:hypothetical protein
LSQLIGQSRRTSRADWHVALEEALRESRERVAPVQAEIGGREAPARDAGDLVDLVEQAAHAPIEARRG